MIKIYRSIADVSREEFNHLRPNDNPFHHYDFFLALEQGGCLGEQRGWAPMYFCKEDSGLKGVFPCFIKGHSYGEYIFDWAWANAYHQHGFLYYPKMVAQTPFTPATCEKVLAHDEATRAELIEAAVEFSKKGMSGFHVLFHTQEEGDEFVRAKAQERLSFQYHWKNQNFESFDGFLKSLAKGKRKNIRKERLRPMPSIEVIEEDALTREHAEEFYQFYLSTIQKKEAIAYLSLSFFVSIFEKLPQQILYLRAAQEGKAFAGALFFQSSTALYGRYWGILPEYESEYSFLHFELCYYRAIELAIERRLSMVEAGAQGEHKRFRGFDPVYTYSSHWIFHEGFRRAIGEFCEREKEEVKGLLE